MRNLTDEEKNMLFWAGVVVGGAAAGRFLWPTLSTAYTAYSAAVAKAAADLAAATTAAEIAAAKAAAMKAVGTLAAEGGKYAVKCAVAGAVGGVSGACAAEVPEAAGKAKTTVECAVGINRARHAQAASEKAKKDDDARGAVVAEVENVDAGKKEIEKLSAEKNALKAMVVVNDEEINRLIEEIRSLRQQQMENAQDALPGVMQGTQTDDDDLIMLKETSQGTTNAGIVTEKPLDTLADGQTAEPANLRSDAMITPLRKSAELRNRKNAYSGSLVEIVRPPSPEFK